MICKDCGGNCEYIGDTVTGSNKKGFYRKISLWSCKLCNKVYRGNVKKETTWK